MRKSWWKILSIGLIIYAIIGGLLLPAPDNEGILGMTIRNVSFHVPMWFTMLVLLCTSFVYGIMYLSTGKAQHDSMSSSFVKVAMLFGLMGLCTGSFWARFTWGYWWIEDPKLNGAAIGMLIYTAYYILRKNIDDEAQKGKFSAVYNLFAFPIFIALIIVYPAMAEVSNHPGSGDSAAFSSMDLDNNLRMVFYPAAIGWILLGVWISSLKYRITEIKRKDEEI